MVSSIESFHCIQDSQLCPSGVLYREVILYLQKSPMNVQVQGRAGGEGHCGGIPSGVTSGEETVMVVHSPAPHSSKVR